MTTPQTVTVALSKPVEHNGETYSHLTFAEATAGDFMTAEKLEGQLSQMAAVLASMANVPFQVIKKIRISDLNRVSKEVQHLLGEPDSAAGPIS